LYPYEDLTSIKEAPVASSFIEVTVDSNENILHISIKENAPYKDLNVILLNAEGKTMHHSEISTTVSGSDHSIRIPSIPAGVYFITISSSEGRVYSQEIFIAAK
jgi:hypothetical protein